MLARFFAPFGISKLCFGLDLAPMVPGLSRAESKAYEFLQPNARASARARARPPKFRASNPAEGNFDDPISEIHLRRAAKRRHVCDKGSTLS